MGEMKNVEMLCCESSSLIWPFKRQNIKSKCDSAENSAGPDFHEQGIQQQSPRKIWQKERQRWSDDLYDVKQVVNLQVLCALHAPSSPAEDTRELFTPCEGHLPYQKPCQEDPPYLESFCQHLNTKPRTLQSRRPVEKVPKCGRHLCFTDSSAPRTCKIYLQAGHKS